jgi:hypothetical protein
MKTTKILAILVVALALMVCPARVSEAAPMGTTFTYQGRLIDANDAADGLYDFAFKLYNASVGGSKAANDVNVAGVDVIDGYFTVELDFDGSAFDGDARWLDIGVRPGDQNDPNVYTALSPRQEVTPVPYALQTRGIFVDNAGNVGIGTTTPAKRLDIASESHTDFGIGLRSKLLGGTSWDIDNDGGVFKIVEHATCGPEFGNNTRIAVVGNCIGSPYGGNVGIGTTSPAATLDVNGTLTLQNGPAINEVSTDGTLADNSDLAIPTEQAVKTYVDSQAVSAGAGVVPVGGVMAWMKSFPNTPSLPSNFAECNGQTLSDANSPYDGQAIPNLNGSGGTKRFLRGSTTSGTTGGSDTHTHSMNFTGPELAGCGGTAPPRAIEGDTNGASSLPSYYEVAWIMRVK